MDKHMTDTNRETGLDGTSIVDLGQNPSFGHGSPIVPTLTKSMLLVDVGDGAGPGGARLMTSRELYLSQGHQPPGLRFEGACPWSEFCWPRAFERMSRTERLSLLGNAQHMAVTGAWVLYCLSNIVDVFDVAFQFDMVTEHKTFMHAVVDLVSDNDTDGDIEVTRGMGCRSGQSCDADRCSSLGHWGVGASAGVL